MYSGQDTFYGSQKPEPGSQSQVIATRTLISDSQGGFPHSEIPGSKPAHGSPGLIAACHVLHRLYAPRHPPNALQTLERHSNSPPMHRDNRTGRTGSEEPEHRRVGGPVPVRLEPSRRLAPTQQRTTCLLQPAVPAIRADLLVRISLQLAEMSRSRSGCTRHHVQVPAALISPSSPCQAAPMIAERSIRAIHRDRV